MLHVFWVTTLKIRERELVVLRSLLQDPKRSDRRIADKLKMSQPTISRLRSRLEETIIESYQIVPKLKLLGFTLISCCLCWTEDTQELLKDGRIIFASPLSSTKAYPCLCIAVHQSYEDFLEFKMKFNAKDEILAPSRPLKPLSFKEIPF